jgi:hypothetical protein
MTGILTKNEENNLYFHSNLSMLNILPASTTSERLHDESENETAVWGGGEFHWTT